jgi:hypothetical protein
MAVQWGNIQSVQSSTKVRSDGSCKMDRRIDGRQQYGQQHSQNDYQQAASALKEGKEGGTEDRSAVTKEEMRNKTQVHQLLTATPLSS